MHLYIYISIYTYIYLSSYATYDREFVIGNSSFFLGSDGLSIDWLRFVVRVELQKRNFKFSDYPSKESCKKASIAFQKDALAILSEWDKLHRKVGPCVFIYSLYMYIPIYIYI